MEPLKPSNLALRELLAQGPSFSSRDLAQRLSITRQAAHLHLKRWLAEGRIERVGVGRATRYRSPVETAFDRIYRTRGLEEAHVWEQASTNFASLASDSELPSRHVLEYALTELVNNAIDHSRAAEVQVRLDERGGDFELTVSDEGIGAFEHLRRSLGLEDPLAALQEIEKGRATSNPEAHSGEGLFFTSKMCREFELRANGLAWLVDNARSDHAVANIAASSGTTVRIRHGRDDTVLPEEVFARYTTDLEFDKTRCTIKLFEHGVRFVSRSEAKRLLRRLDQFREVLLDFDRVEGVGQGFADEVFRVWARAHPDVTLGTQGMNAAVEFMVERARAAARKR
jgi:anti-sigma regulatory factor (Ser/Thr protein kinase)